MELEELYRIKRVLEDRKDNFRGHTGDQTYQDLLEDLESIEAEIEESETN